MINLKCKVALRHTIVEANYQCVEFSENEKDIEDLWTIETRETERTTIKSKTDNPTPC